MRPSATAAPQQPAVISLLPCATDCVLALQLDHVLVGRSHECSGSATLSAVPVCTEPKLGFFDPSLLSGARHGSGAGDSSHVSTGLSPMETHMAASTLKAAAWELSWGLRPPMGFDPCRAVEGDPSQAVAVQPYSEAAALTVQWGVSPFLTNPAELRRLQPDILLTQLQPVEGALDKEGIKAALEHVVGKPVMVLHLDPTSLAEVFYDYNRIGRALGPTGGARAPEAVREMRRKMEVVQAMCSGRERRRVLCLQWLDPVFTAGAWVPELVRMAGGTPVGYEVSAQASGAGVSSADALLYAEKGEASWEALTDKGMVVTGSPAKELVPIELLGAVQQADIVVVAVCGWTLAESLQHVTRMIQRKEGPLGAALPASTGPTSDAQQAGSVVARPMSSEAESREAKLSRSRVAVVDGSTLFSRPGPWLVQSLEALAEIIHPELQHFGHEGKHWQYL